MKMKQAIPWAIIGLLVTSGALVAAYDYTLKGTVTVDDKAWASATTSADTSGTTVDAQVANAVKDMIESPYKTEVNARFNRAMVAVRNTNDLSKMEAAAVCMEQAIR